MNCDLLARPLLLVRGLTRTYCQGHWPRYRKFRALDGVSLILRAGKTLALVGSSGSGKTTLAMCLAALERPDSGEIWLDECDLVAAQNWQLAKARTHVQMLLQDSAGALSPRLSAADIVEEPIRVHHSIPRAHRNEEVVDLFRLVGLAPELRNRRIHQLSGGQRQRLAIARALALSPRLIILDEPFAGLDLSARGQIINLLLELQAANNIAYLYISHDLDVVRYFADEIAVMECGRIVEMGPANLVLRNSSHPRTQLLIDASAALHARHDCARGTAVCAI